MNALHIRIWITFRSKGLLIIMKICCCTEKCMNPTQGCLITGCRVVMHIIGITEKYYSKQKTGNSFVLLFLTINYNTDPVHSAGINETLTCTRANVKIKHDTPRCIFDHTKNFNFHLCKFRELPINFFANVVLFFTNISIQII